MGNSLDSTFQRSGVKKEHFHDNRESAPLSFLLPQLHGCQMQPARFIWLALYIRKGFLLRFSG